MELKLKIVILAVVIAIVSAIICLFPKETFALLFFGFLLLVLVTLLFGLAHPKWYVKLYTVICFFWDGYFWFYWVYAGPFSPFTTILVAYIGLAPPLIPLWYLWYKGGWNKILRKEGEVKK